jgi:hypothetical protein
MQMGRQFVRIIIDVPVFWLCAGTAHLLNSSHSDISNHPIAHINDNTQCYLVGHCARMTALSVKWERDRAVVNDREAISARPGSVTGILTTPVLFRSATTD